MADEAFASTLKAHLLQTTAASAFVRVTRLKYEVLMEDRTNPVRVTRSYTHALMEDRTNPVRTTKIYINALTSIKEKDPPPEPLRPVFPAKGKVELNPYRPYLPAELDGDPVLGRFMKEQIETLRRQHNLIQAGDTTYPWEVLTEVNDKREFTLGSMGRFYHPSFGLVVARYVQFGKIAATEWLAAPVGWQKGAQLVDWVVTNDFTQSDAEMACGVIMCYTLPAAGKFGWMVTQGANLVSLNAQYFTPRAQGQEYVWSQTGEIKPDGRGRVLGRLWGTRTDNLIPPGSFFVDVAGWSGDSLRERVADDLAALNEAVETLQAAIAGLEENQNLGDHQAIIALQEALGKLTTRIAKEEGNRANRDAALQEQINNLGGNENALENLRTQLTNLINESNGAQDILIDAARSRANAAYALAASIDPAGIMEQLAGLQVGLGDLVGRLVGFKVLMDPNLAIPGQILVYRIDSHDPDTGINYGSFHLEDAPGGGAGSGGVLPVVTGDVPPVFVYLDDGSLVYSEIV